MKENITTDLEFFISAHFGADFLQTIKQEKCGFRMLMSRLRKLVNLSPATVEYLVEFHPWLMFAVDTHTCDACVRVGWKTIRRHKTWRRFLPCLMIEWKYYDKQWQAARKRIELFLMQEGLKSVLPMNNKSTQAAERFLALIRKVQGYPGM